MIEPIIVIVAYRPKPGKESETLASSDKIAGVLYVKRDDKWIQVSVENSQGVVEGAN
jgi:hypothetical protein